MVIKNFKDLNLILLKYNIINIYNMGFINRELIKKNLV